MATSGWQNEQTIITQTFSSYVMLKGNVRIDTLTHSGTNLRVTGSIALCTRQRQGSGGSITYTGYDQYCTPEGGSERVICSKGTKMSVGTDFHSNFDVTLTGVSATTTSRSFRVNFRCPSGQYGYNVDLYWTLNFAASGTTPTGLDVTLTSVQDTSAVMNVTLGSYGTPSSEANRYIEAAIMGQSTYGGKYRYATQKATTSAAITVSNSSSTNSSNPLTIVPNTQYWYGAYASNTVMSTSMVKGTFLTLPAYITRVTANDVGQGDIYFTVNHASEGSASTVYTEISYDQSVWQAVNESFHVVLTGHTTIYFRRRNDAGATPVYTLSVVPSTRVKLYGSASGEAEEIVKLYGSVDGESKRIVKLYGSVNGRSKLLFTDSGGPWANRGMGTGLNPYGISTSYGDTISVEDNSSYYGIDVQALANGLVMGAGYYRVYLPANTVPSGSKVEFGIYEECFGGDDYITMDATVTCDNEYVSAIVLQFDGDYTITYVRAE